MGKTIISQARGKGSPTYRVRRKAYMHNIKYPMKEGEGEVIKIFHSAGHTAPLIAAKVAGELFYNAAFDGCVQGQKISIGKIGDKDAKNGDVLMIKDIESGTNVYNIEKHPGEGGKMMRSGGTCAVILKIHEHNKVSILMPNKKELMLSGDCRATVGRVAGGGRVLKPFIKAGRKYYKMKARNKLWPRVSAVKMNAVDHPFGSGRGKRIKSKIAKRNAPAGRRVGHISPRRTGRRN